MSLGPFEHLYRVVNAQQNPLGAPGIRDPDGPCDLFDGQGYDGRGDCLSDGHYLCVECSKLSPTAPRFEATYGRQSERVPGSLARLDRIRALRWTMKMRAARIWATP